MTMLDDEMTALVVAAQRGDQTALDRLVTQHLPLVYDIVGRAIDRREDADDVVQETMLRAVRKLPTLRRPASFRSWLTAIAIRQVGTHQQRRATTHAGLDEAVSWPDPAADVEGMTAVRLAVSAQRHQVAQATRWLDRGDRAVLALWWQEVAGRMNRAEIADALHLSVAHSNVRIQRMRDELDLARGVTAALSARPRCSPLSTLTAAWDGTPNPLWRKRIARHVRSCAACSAAAGERVPAERLLANVPALVVPAGFAQATLAKTVAASSTASASGTATAAAVTQAVTAHPLAGAFAAITAAAVVVVPFVHSPGTEPARPRPVAVPAVSSSATTPPVSTTSRPARPTPAPATTPAPTRSRTALAGTTGPSTSPISNRVYLGSLSLEWVGGGYLASDEGSAPAAVIGLDENSGAANRRRATFTATAGLADATCFSFRTRDGRYLRHYELQEYTSVPQDTAIFRGDATYCPTPGLDANSVMFRSFNYPDFCLRWTGTELGIGYFKDTSAFRRSSSFRVRPALESS
ncbi:sigma-70 family RNA polymerase sigma factor [Kineosporia sp. NBRC 101731]|uniref:sigma-70 family RNA polymerase sigma factor n=1 Tax=Kineosporia sp. NBRC 101731 TaxID=3032199 RepID=UPI0024A1E58A|nr:sigma-70 family RNA polymerase sigma factor [Kineosporia sp. NBRC 101731]GLY29751.1 hypothetical protein Kisp02_31160 [Kineosporia sp. NBRC 101731]